MPVDCSRGRYNNLSRSNKKYKPLVTVSILRLRVDNIGAIFDLLGMQRQPRALCVLY